MAERLTLFINVILPVPIRKEFTYRVPFDLNEAIFAGARVVVPFGRSKLITGIVTSIHENIPKDYSNPYASLLAHLTRADRRTVQIAQAQIPNGL